MTHATHDLMDRLDLLSTLADENAVLFPQAAPDHTLTLAANLMTARAHAAIQAAFADFLTPFGLTVVRYTFLRALYVAEAREATVSQLSRRLGVTVTNVAKQVDWLEQQGWVVRAGTPQDRRVTYARLTPEGVQRFETLLPEVSAFIGTLWQDVAAEDQAQVLRTMSALRDSIVRRHLSA